MNEIGFRSAVLASLDEVEGGKHHIRPAGVPIYGIVGYGWELSGQAGRFFWKGMRVERRARGVRGRRSRPRCFCCLVLAQRLTAGLRLRFAYAPSAATCSSVTPVAYATVCALTASSQTHMPLHENRRPGAAAHRAPPQKKPQQLPVAEASKPSFSKSVRIHVQSATPIWRTT